MAGEDVEDGAGKNFDIEPERAIFDVPDIELEFLLPGDVVATIDLRPAGYAGFHGVPLAVVGDLLRQHFDELGPLRPGADDHHLSAQHQCIEITGIELYRLLGRPDCAEHVAGIELETSGIRPEIRIARLDPSRLVDRSKGIGQLGEGGECSGADTQRISAEFRIGIAGLGERLLVFALQQQCMRPQVCDLLRFVARAHGALQLGFGSNSIVEREHRSCQSEMRLCVTGIGTDGGERLRARRSGIVRSEQLLALGYRLLRRGRVEPRRRQREPRRQHQHECTDRTADHDQAAEPRRMPGWAGALTAGGHRPSSDHRGSAG